jgi:hypothetical protein
MTVYEVLYYDARRPGPAGDCTHVARFRSKRNAEAFAKGRECYGKPATVESRDAPPRLVNPWSFQG